MLGFSKDLIKNLKEKDQAIIDLRKSRRILKFVLVTCIELNNCDLNLNNFGLSRI